MITFDEVKNKYQNKPLKDNEVHCTVLTKLKDGYLVEINDEWEGFLPNNHFNGSSSEQNLQEKFGALVIAGPDKSDRYIVSPKALKEKQTYQKLEKIKEENITIKVNISKVIKGGAEVYIEDVRAFLPGRYIKLPGISQENWANQEIDVFIEEIDYKEKKIILNHKKAYDLDKQKKAEATIQKLKEGDIVEAPILRIAEFGVFVDLGGLDGLIPASELSWGRFNHPREIVKIGQVVQGRIFRIEREKLRVALSVKQLLGDPWEQIELDIDIGSKVTGKVVSEAPFGMFVEIKPGVEALLHNSEIPENAEKPKLGKTITTKVIKINSAQRKIGLTLRDLEEQPQEDQYTTTQDYLQEEKTTTETEPIVQDVSLIEEEIQKKQDYSISEENIQPTENIPLEEIKNPEETHN